VLGYSDGRVSMYRLIQAGARLDGEFFPESQARRSWDSAASYERFLIARRADYVVAWGSYDTQWHTNEHALIDEIAAAPRCRSSGVAIAEVFTTSAYDVYRVDSCGAHEG
jgi:hypothetical protein